MSNIDEIINFLNKSLIYRMKTYTLFFKETIWQQDSLPLFCDQFDQADKKIVSGVRITGRILSGVRITGRILN